MSYSSYAAGSYALASPYAPYAYGVVYQSVQPVAAQPIASAGETTLPASATIVVNLPEDARLTVDDTPTKGTSTSRVFTTPPLDRGRSYYYTLKGEIVRDGRTITATKRVVFRAGAETRVSLDFPDKNVAQK